jgi:hypothetical protein
LHIKDIAGIREKLIENNSEKHLNDIFNKMFAEEEGTDNNF